MHNRISECKIHLETGRTSYNGLTLLQIPYSRHSMNTVNSTYQALLLFIGCVPRNRFFFSKIPKHLIFFFFLFKLSFFVLKILFPRLQNVKFIPVRVTWGRETYNLK